ncbi:Condensin-2 complex subunit g2 [Thalictrum thalictroides]|uniref:Condensin-2 complex subunit g2 n=1 Tax=Thalictrum thalictroides TaxID=46969 RepID=A0A7J6WJU4_THATH|nr:Condensin-2 complex subunit g2 [Thalictrum thalictroides]
MEKRLRSSLQNSAEEFLSSATKIGSKAAKPLLKTLICKITSSSELISSLPLALYQSTTRSIDLFKQLLESNGNDDCIDSPITSPVTKRLRKSSRRRKNVTEELNNEEEEKEKEKEEKVSLKREVLIQSLEIYAYVAFLCVSHPKNLFSCSDLLPSVQVLHDNLVLFENDSGLLFEIAKLCEEWWKEQLEGRESLISQTLPFLLSKSLTLRKKVDVHRVYALREAFCLFDFDDESIDDLKNLLLRCIIDPLYLKMDEGRRFIAFLFGLSGQLVKEALALIRSQIPFGRKSVLEAYADILFRSWKVAESSSREEIENGLLQGLVEGAIYASSESLAASVRRVLGGFVSQRTTDGVEKLLFRLTEPVIFRSLQVANSNVRKNALHLLLDVFPLEDPDATKDVKDALIEKQFFLLERLLLDECPDVRVVAVEGSCRILYLFWEIIPSSTITKTITKIIDDMSYDLCTEVRLSTINGITYLLGNPQTHELLKVLLPRLGHLFLDRLLSVRVALADLLLTLSDIHTFQFHKVVGMDTLLSSLSNDEKVVAQKITRLLMPSYFPTNISPEEACTRCITLIKRSPIAGARFCEFVFIEGSPLNFLMELVRVSVNLVVSENDLDPNQIEGLLVALVNLCRSLVTEASYKASLKKMLSGKKLKRLFSAGATKHAQTAIFNIASVISVDDATDLVKECMVPIRNCGGLSLNVELQAEVRSVHKLMMSCGRFDEMFVALIELLQKAASGCRTKFSSGSSTHSVPNVKQKKPKLSNKCSTKSENVKGNKTSSRDATADFQEHYIVAAGAAWQMKDLLTSADTRHAVLKSPKLEVAFSALKLISEFSIEQCMHLEYIDTSPVLAYTALALHAELHNADLARTSDLGVKKTNTTDFNRSLLKGNALELALNHLFGCTKRLFTESESGDLPKTCGCKPSDGGK